MTNHNPTNERVKRHYFAFLAEAQGHSEQTIDTVAKAISRFEAYTRYKDFKAFHIEQHRKHWSNASPIRTIFKEAFAAAGLPYFNPHSFRKTLALLGGELCETPEQYKAWSQNLGHEHVLTTFTSYGDVSSYRQAEIIRAMA